MGGGGGGGGGGKLVRVVREVKGVSRNLKNVLAGLYGDLENDGDDEFEGNDGGWEKRVMKTSFKLRRRMKRREIPFGGEGGGGGGEAVKLCWL